MQLRIFGSAGFRLAALFSAHLNLLKSFINSIIRLVYKPGK